MYKEFQTCHSCPREKIINVGACEMLRMLVRDKDFKAAVVTVLGEVKENYFCAQRKGSQLSTPSRKYRKELPMALCPSKSGLKSSLPIPVNGFSFGNRTLQMKLVKMESHQVRVGAASNDSCLYKKRRNAEATEGRTPSVAGGRLQKC